ncbi:MAG: DUF6145 family protein [Cellulosilyticaceae bacterium]
MEKKLVVCASPEHHKYFLEPEFNDIPNEIKEEIIESVAAIAEKANTIISLGFYEDGNLYIEQQTPENVFVDNIGAELEIKKFQKEKEELLRSMRLWYLVYRTEQGQIVKEVVVYQAKGLKNEAIIEAIQKQYGETAISFVKMLLEES